MCLFFGLFTFLNTGALRRLQEPLFFVTSLASLSPCQKQNLWDEGFYLRKWSQRTREMEGTVKQGRKESTQGVGSCYWPPATVVLTHLEPFEERRQNAPQHCTPRRQAGGGSLYPLGPMLEGVNFWPFQIPCWQCQEREESHALSGRCLCEASCSDRGWRDTEARSSDPPSWDSASGQPTPILAKTPYFPEYLLPSLWTRVLSTEHSSEQRRGSIIRVRYSFSKKSHTALGKPGWGWERTKERLEPGEWKPAS